MSIEATLAVSALGAANVGATNLGAAAPASLPVAPASEKGAFDALVSGIQSMSAQMNANAAAVQTLAIGDTESLHRVIMDLEATKMKFDMALQVRNKVLEAYQELMRMQI